MLSECGSPGHERFPERIAGWKEVDLLRYIAKGTHQISWSLKEPRIKGHIALLLRALENWPQTRELARQRVMDLKTSEMIDALADLPQIQCTIPLTTNRFNLVLRLLDYRLSALKELLK